MAVRQECLVPFKRLRLDAALELTDYNSQRIALYKLFALRSILSKRISCQIPNTCRSVLFLWCCCCISAIALHDGQIGAAQFVAGVLLLTWKKNVTKHNNNAATTTSLPKHASNKYYNSKHKQQQPAKLHYMQVFTNQQQHLLAPILCCCM